MKNEFLDCEASAINPSNWLFALFIGLYAVSAVGQQAPDTGQLLQQQPKPPVIAPAEPAPIVPTTPEQVPTTVGPKVLVKKFHITGAILIPESELAAQLKFAVGKELTLDQLRGTAMLLTAYYLERGYLARAILPPQEIRDGIVEIQIIEGRRGRLMIDIDGEQIDSSRVRDFIDYGLARGEVLDMSALGKAMAILNEQPGVEATAAIKPGAGEAEVDIAVKASEQPARRYSLSLNNHGSYGSGEEQAKGVVVFNNPFGHFDMVSLLVNLSEGSAYGRADFSMPAGGSGLRVGANLARMTYRLVPDSFAALEAEGEATTYGLTASYPIARRTDFNLSLAGTYDDKRLVDRTVAGESSNRHVKVFTLGLDGYVMSGALGGGVASFGASYTRGNSDQDNATALAADSTSRRVQGDFSKLSYSLGWLSSLPYALSLNTTLRGQIPGNNLDSSEQFSLGGTNGVRAYPTGEASGDEGWLFSVNIGKKLSGKLSTSLFFDAGSIRLNHTLWSGWNASNPDLPNTYILYGVGAGVDWRFSQAVLLSASIANPIGSNPGADTSDLNVDGSENGLRGWINISAKF